MKRSTRPAFIGPVITAFMRRFGRTASDIDLGTKWADLIGKDTLFIHISRNKKESVLYIKVLNPAAALAISYQTADIIQKVNTYFGYKAVDKIVIK